MSCVTLAHMDLLERGCVFQKFHDRESRVEPRLLWVDFQDQRLYWCKEGQKVKLPNCGVELMELTRVSITKEAEFPIFDLNSYARDVSEDLLLTLTFDHISQSLHLAAPTVDMRDRWLEAIDALMEEHEKQYQEYQAELEAQEREDDEQRHLQDEEERQSPPEHLPQSQPTLVDMEPEEEYLDDGVDEMKYDQLPAPPSATAATSSGDRLNFNNPRPTPNSAAAAMIQQGDDELFDDEPPAFADFSRSSKARARGGRVVQLGSNSIDDEYAAIEAEQAAMEAKKAAKSQPKSRQSPLDAMFGISSPPPDVPPSPSSRSGGGGMTPLTGSRNAGVRPSEEKQSDSSKPLAQVKSLTQLQKPAKQSKPIGAQPIQVVSRDAYSAANTATHTADSTPSVTRRNSRDLTSTSSKARLPVYASAFDRAVLPNPMPKEMRQAIQTALGSVVLGAYQRIDAKREESSAGVKKLKKRTEELERAKAELERRNDELEQHVGERDEEAEQLRARMVELEEALAVAHESEERHEAEWHSLALATGSLDSGKIEVRLATANLEHEAPHQYVGILYIQHPLEDAFEYSQTVSLMRSADGATYLPKLILSPTELFAFRQPEEDDEDDAGNDEDEDEAGASSHRSNRSQSGSQKKSPSKRKQKKAASSGEDADEGELVGAQLRLEVWDLINQRMYGSGEDEYGNVFQTGYAGHVDWDMNDLIAAKHHVMSLDLVNDTDRKKEAQWRKQAVKIVLQYCLPIEADEEPTAGASAQPSGKPLTSKQLASGSTDPLLTLQLTSLEEELLALKKAHADLQEDHAIYQDQAAQFTEERKVRLALEQRLVAEQVIRVKQEQEVMRLKPRALELVDTTDELAAARRKIRDMEFTVSTLQKELRKQTLPPTPHAMLDELLHLEKPGLVDLLRVKKFILEQERVRAMLVEEMASAQKHYVTYETTHDELVRRENALHTHCHWLEDEKRKLEAQSAELTAALHTLQAQTLQLSKRCEQSESEKELMHVNLSYLGEQQKLHRAKIGELERALLVHHGQMDHFEFAKVPVPQHVEANHPTTAQMMLDDLPEFVSDTEDDTPDESDRDEQADAARADDQDGKDAGDAATGGGGAGSGPLPKNNPKKAKRPPRRTKIVYSDALEQSLAAAGANWTGSSSS